MGTNYGPGKWRVLGGGRENWKRRSAPREVKRAQLRHRSTPDQESLTPKENSHFVGVDLYSRCT